MQHYQTLRTEIRNSILTLTIHRPEKLNALSEQVFLELRHIFLAIRGANRRDVRGVIITGSGERAFIAGADIQAMSQMTAEEGEQFGAFGQLITEMIESLPIPVIAAVNGFALGGGCEIAMSCDYIFATEKAVFGQPEVNLGLIPGFGGCVRLLRYVGPGRAKELIYTGRNVSAAEAKAIGLVNEVFGTREEMLLAAENSLALIARKSSVAVAICKKVINQSFGASTGEALEHEKAGFREAFESQDKQVGVRAFLEKRPPEWMF